MRFQHPITPAVINETILLLCCEISVNSTPIYVDVRPLSEAQINDCFALVDTQVRLHGGEAVLGWSIWEMPGLFVEAEFHAVWQSPMGELLDIAPKSWPTARIFFLPDPVASYKGIQVNNVRRAINNDSDVSEYLRGFDDIFEFMNRGERAALHGEIHLADVEAQEYETICRRNETSYLRIASRIPIFGPYTACWCGSGKKMKWCHKTIG